jgi:hypothetical protein
MREPEVRSASAISQCAQRFQFRWSKGEVPRVRKGREKTLCYDERHRNPTAIAP